MDPHQVCIASGSGTPRPTVQKDLKRALQEVRPTTGPWFAVPETMPFSTTKAVPTTTGWPIYLSEKWFEGLGLEI